VGGYRQEVSPLLASAEGQAIGELEDGTRLPTFGVTSHEAGRDFSQTVKTT